MKRLNKNSFKYAKNVAKNFFGYAEKHFTIPY